jgi:hypothetical protein
LIRTQHPAFGTEIRAVLASTISEEAEIASTLRRELRALDDARRLHRPHPREDKLEGGELGDVRYLRIYRHRQSIRVYFVAAGDTLTMLAIDIGKRRHEMTAGMKARLADRLRDGRAR